jgi:hypothetical protein
MSAERITDILKILYDIVADTEGTNQRDDPNPDHSLTLRLAFNRLYHNLRTCLDHARVDYDEHLQELNTRYRRLISLIHFTQGTQQYGDINAYPTR